MPNVSSLHQSDGARLAKQDPNEQTTGRIMLELSDSMDEMTDLEWDNLAERIMAVFEIRR